MSWKLVVFHLYIPCWPAYSPHILELLRDVPCDFLLEHYLQSHRYFARYATALRHSVLRFRDDLRDRAEDFINSINTLQIQQPVQTVQSADTPARQQTRPQVRSNRHTDSDGDIATYTHTQNDQGDGINSFNRRALGTGTATQVTRIGVHIRRGIFSWNFFTLIN